MPRASTPLRAWFGALLVTLAGLAATGAGPDSPASAVPVVFGIQWRDPGLVIRASAPLTPEIFSLREPDRFVIDLPAAELADADLAQTIPIGIGPLKQVRLAQKEYGAVRVVIDVDAATPFQLMQSGDRTTIVVARAGVPHAGLWALLAKPAAPEGAGQIVRAVWAREDAGGLTLHLQAEAPLRYFLFEEAPGRLQVRVPKGRFQGELPRPGRLLAAASATPAADQWALDVALAAGDYELSQTPSPDARGLTLRWVKRNPRRFPGRPLVVLDPGHGGHDPGAIGPGGTNEKDVSLAIAKAVREALWRRRLNAVLTRTADAEMHLAPRVAMIDQYRADLFVSLHANSHTTPGVSGTETYWREPHSLPFALALHRRLAALDGRLDRGVKQERLYVLRHPRVPSLLWESGFISNPQEERLIGSPLFQAGAAEAIAAGIAAHLGLPPLADAGDQIR